MALQILPKESAAKANPAAKPLLDHLQSEQVGLGLEDAVVFYNFPLFREEEQLLVAELVVISPLHGVVLVSTSDGDLAQPDEYAAAAARLEGAFSQIFSRLVKYPRLRASRATLSFPLEAYVWSEEGEPRDDLLVGLRAVNDHFASIRLAAPIGEDVFSELVSVLDGSKALNRPRERATKGFDTQSKVAIVTRLEEEIRRFDRDQRVAYMTEVHGPQRIRGLAGSGKTVVLALKAALTAVREPEARIAVTFYTKSLYQHIKQLITRFYRMHEDRDPDWKRLQVLHAWGGASADGLYYLAARRFGHQALTYGQASALDAKQPFGHACGRLLEDPNVSRVFDYVFVDEGQDFPPEFMRLALRLASEERLVIAYDVFQTIFDLEVPTAASLFGTDSDDEPDIAFDEDIILHKCYRNPREVLVCAHAIGFGVYGPKVVQMLESREHWEDFGYSVTGGALTAGEQVQITRPRENSPSSLSESSQIDEIIAAKTFTDIREETDFVVRRVVNDIREQGLAPEDILVICADDRNAAGYFKLLGRALSAEGIRFNNLQDDSYTIRDFHQQDCVTLSTIYKAKGNEAYSVYIVGIDALFASPNARNRNRAFTAMTRAKGWLCVTGLGGAARAFSDELTLAKRHYPDLVFRYPSPEELVYMKRDLVQIDPAEADEALTRLADEMEPDEFEHLLRKRLRDIQSRKKPQKKVAK